MLHGIKASRQEIWGSGKRLESDADPVKAYRDKIFLTFISLHEDGIGIAPEPAKDLSFFCCVKYYAIVPYDEFHIVSVSL